MTWSWLKHQILLPAEQTGSNRQAKGVDQGSQVDVTTCSFQEHQGQFIQGSFSPSREIKKEGRKRGQSARVRRLPMLQPLRGQTAGPHYSQEDSEELPHGLASAAG